MPSSSRTSLTALTREHPSALEINQADQGNTPQETQVAETPADETLKTEVLEVEGLVNEKVNNTTEPAQAIINSLAVEPDLEKATTTIARKRRTRKSTKSTTTAAKTKTATRARKSTKTTRKTKTT